VSRRRRDDGGGSGCGRGGHGGHGRAASSLPTGPRVVQSLLKHNGELGRQRRWLTRWQGERRPSWEAAGKLPDAMLLAFEEGEQIRLNVAAYAALEPQAPLLGADGTTGVSVCDAADAADATDCALYLQQHWTAKGGLQLPSGTRCLGYASYPKTLERHDAAVQSSKTLLITNALLPITRKYVKGFEAMETAFAGWLHERFGHVVTLHYAHALRQSPATLSATGFDVHQDTEDYPHIKYTVVVKLTPDQAGEAPSAMRVVGAQRHFEYEARAGAAGCFLAQAYHASVPPTSPNEHLKIAFFFKLSERGERRAGRNGDPLDTRPMREGVQHAGVMGLQVVTQRQQVMHELNAASIASEHMLPR